jgi:hypothetical protein
LKEEEEEYGWVTPGDEYGWVTPGDEYGVEAEACSPESGAGGLGAAGSAGREGSSTWWGRELVALARVL